MKLSSTTLPALFSSDSVQSTVERKTALRGPQQCGMEDEQELVHGTEIYTAFISAAQEVPECKQRLHSRWSSSSRVIVDKPPSRPLSRQLSGGPSSGGSVKESRTDPGVGDAHRRGNASKRVHQNHSRWASGFGVINDRPPFQSPSCRGSAVERLHQSDSRWSSGCRATFDATSSEALARLIQKNPESIDLGEEAMAQLRNYVSIITATMHRENPPHNFEHASHVTTYVARMA
jgi:hypothetical protein